MCFTCSCFFVAFCSTRVSKKQHTTYQATYLYLAVLMDTMRNTYCVMESVNHICVTPNTCDEAIQVIDGSLVELVL